MASTNGLPLPSILQTTSSSGNTLLQYNMGTHMSNGAVFSPMSLLEVPSYDYGNGDKLVRYIYIRECPNLGSWGSRFSHMYMYVFRIKEAIKQQSGRVFLQLSVQQQSQGLCMHSTCMVYGACVRE